MEALGALGAFRSKLAVWWPRIGVRPLYRGLTPGVENQRAQVTVGRAEADPKRLGQFMLGQFRIVRERTHGLQAGCLIDWLHMP